jgi:molybdopterin synthase catalytic subunit
VQRHLFITPDPINESALTAARRASAGMGAVVCFSGVVRGSEEGRPIAAIDYEAFRAMAEHQFHKLFDEMV